MNLIKKYWSVIIVIIPIIILVVIRSTGTGHFRNDARMWMEPSINKSNIITKEQLPGLSDKYLIINVDNEPCSIPNLTGKIENISGDSVLGKFCRMKIRNHKGPVLLYSADAGISARIWMILSQLGLKNVLILTNNADNEVLKFNFKPDSLSVKSE